MTNSQLVELFKSSKANISEHIKNIFEFEELDKEATVRKFRTVLMEGKRAVERDRVHYNLDVIIAIGYRVNSKRGTQFRQWATQRLKQYLIQGYTPELILTIPNIRSALDKSIILKSSTNSILCDSQPSEKTSNIFVEQVTLDL